LKTRDDAFGQGMWAYYEGENVIEVVERDDGYVDPAEELPKGYFSSIENWSPIQRKAMEYIKGRVLDVGCGAGKHSLYLQGRGFDVLGIDNSPLAVEICRLRGLRKTELFPIEKLSPRLGEFDTILMLGNNFGLFGSFEKAQKLLKRFQKMTSKDAFIIAETLDPYDTTDPIHLEYHEHNRQRGRMGGQVRIRVRFRKFISRWFDYLFVSKEEMESVLQRTGWRIRGYLDSGDAIYIAVIEKT
jgi:SAM-dependent methyltransferase